jgi:hypothetical protein
MKPTIDHFAERPDFSATFRIATGGLPLPQRPISSSPISTGIATKMTQTM